MSSESQSRSLDSKEQNFFVDLNIKSEYEADTKDDKVEPFYHENPEFEQIYIDEINIKEELLKIQKNEIEDTIIEEHTTEIKIDQCNVCALVLSQKFTLEEHLIIHAVENPSECNPSIPPHAKESCLNLNIQTPATYERPYKCDYCGLRFSQNIILTSHLKMHAKPKPKPYYKCCFCTSIFSKSIDMKRHLKDHTGGKSFECKYCPLAFEHKLALIGHERTHVSEKPYKCAYCISSFSARTPLLYHIKTHTGEKPYKCKYCTSEFIRKYTLKRHTRTHTGEKPYKCDYCASLLADKTSLIRHIRRHMDGKLYKCQYCTTAFAHKTVLRKHVCKNILI